MGYGFGHRSLGLLGRLFAIVLVIGLSFTCAWAQDESAVSPSSQTTVSVPRLIKFSSSLRDTAGNPRVGSFNVTFSIYPDQSGGAPLWTETQAVTSDAAGRYTVLLGNTSATGLPLEIFANGEARWLSIQAEGDTESSRTVMVSVPYALKAIDAETLGGKPASAFVLADPVSGKTSLRTDTTNTSAASRTVESTAAVDNGGIGGTINRVTKWTSATNIGDSQIFDDGTNVGIGTATPTTKLNVVGSAPAFGAIRMQVQNTSNGGYSDIAIQNDAGGYGQFGITGSAVSGPFGNAAGAGSVYMQGGAATAFGTVVNAPFIMGTNNIERMRITSTGNVGIGTAFPNFLLHLSGTIGGGGAVRERIQNLSNAGYTDILVQNNSTGTAQFGITGSTVPGPFGNAVGTGSVYMQGGAPTAFGTVVSAPFILGTNNVERLRIDAAGNDGIGTNAPSSPLHVSGSVGGGGTVRERIQNLNSAGSTDLLMQNDTTGTTQIGVAGSATAAPFSLGVGASFLLGSGATGLGNSSSAPLVLATNNLERLRVTGAGNVGIGNTAPAEVLDVTGNVKATSFIGSGASLTGVSASSLAAGTYSNAYTFDNVGNAITGTFTGNGAALTSVTAAGLAAGTYSNALTLNNAANSFTGNGSGLTNVTASALAAGTYSNALTLSNAANSFTGNGSGLTNVTAGALSAGTYSNALTLNNAANSFTGNGAGLTNVTASGLAAGTYANALTLSNAANAITGVFTGNGAALTNVTATGLAAGTYANALTLSNAANAITGVFTGNGAALTNVTASGLAAGTYANALTLSNAANAITGVFTGNGAALTNVNASGLAAGTYANIYTFNNAGNAFTGSHTGNGSGLTNVTASGLAAGTYANALTLSNATNAITGVFTGNGAALTNVSASGLAAGTYANIYTFNNASNAFTGSHTGNGSGLTNVTASGLAAGTYANALTLSNASNAITGTFTGNGAAVTNVTAAGLAAGTYANAYNFSNAGNVYAGNGAALTGVTATIAAGTDITGNNATHILRAQQNGSIAAGFFSVASPPPAAFRGNALVTSGQAVGVIGSSVSSTGEGVVGMNTASNGSSIGILGISSTASTDSSNPGGNGVWGEATATTGNTAGVFGRAASVNGTGVFGQATATSGDAIGVYGTSAAAGGTGIFGEVTNVSAGPAGNVGVYGRVADSATNSAAGQFDVTGTANILIGRQGVSPVNKFRVDSTGKGFFNGGTATSGADFAESVSVRDEKSAYQPGDLIAIDTEGVRRFTKSSKPYSTLVAGIYSTKPGILASPHHIDDTRVDTEEIPLAVVGIVPCKVSAENGEIETGDLLVASSTPGYAMKGTDRSKMNGAVIGKALQPMHGKTGVIEVLVSLQ